MTEREYKEAVMRYNRVERFTDRIEAVIRELVRDPEFCESEHTFRIDVVVTNKDYNIHTLLTAPNSLGGVTYLGEGSRYRGKE